MPRVLLITYYFPPDYLIPQTRAWRIANGLGRHGWNVDVVAPKIRAHLGPSRETYSQGSVQDWGRLRQLPDTVTVHRVQPGLAAWITGRMAQEAHPDAGAAGLPDKPRASAWSAKGPLPGVLAALTRNRSKASWIPFALSRTLGLARQRRYDLVLTSSTPYVNHLLGYLLSGMLDLPWVADLRDSWALFQGEQFLRMHPGRVQRMVHRAAMDRVMLRADGVWSLCPGYTEELVRRYQGRVDAQRFKTFPLGMASFGSPSVPPDPCRCVFAYAGTIKPQYVGVDPLLNGLRLLRSREPLLASCLTVRVYSRDHANRATWKAARKAGLDDMFDFRPMMCERALVSDLAEATALLSLCSGDALGKLRYSGKLFTYLAAGRPIMLMGPPDSLQADVVRATNTGFVVEPEPQAVAENLERIIRQWQAGNPPRVEANADELRRLSFDGAILPGMVAELERILCGRAGSGG